MDKQERTRNRVGESYGIWLGSAVDYVRSPDNLDSFLDYRIAGAGLLLILYFFHKLAYEITERREVEHYSSRLETIIQNRSSDLSNTITMLENEIAERKCFEDNLTTASQDWRKTFDSIKDIIIMLDADFHVVKINRAGAVFFRKSYQEIIGTSVYSLIEESPPDDNLLVKMKNTKKHYEQERYMTDGDLWVSVSVAPILNDRGEVTGAVLIMKDMTEIKKCRTP